MPGTSKQADIGMPMQPAQTLSLASDSNLRQELSGFSDSNLSQGVSAACGEAVHTGSSDPFVSSAVDYPITNLDDFFPLDFDLSDFGIQKLLE